MQHASAVKLFTMDAMNYCISGIWKDKGQVTHVLLHERTGEGFQPGIKISLATLVSFISAGKFITIMFWNYDTGKFYTGPVLEAENIDGKIVLKQNNDRHYSLENLPCMNGLVDEPAGIPLIRKRN